MDLIKNRRELLPIILIIFFAFIIIFLSKNMPSDQIEKINMTNTRFSEQWALNNNGESINGNVGIKGIDINILEAWERTRGSSEVIIGILDSGIDINNNELKGAIFINKKEIPNNGKDDDNNGYIDDYNGWNFYDCNNQIYDNYLHDYHGTYIAGIIAASHGSVYGVAPNVKVLPLKFMKGSQGSVNDAIDAIKYAHSMNVRIINCSWDSTVYDKNLDNIMKSYSDILFICSTGKLKNDLGKTPVYPACYDLPNVISVAAINNEGKLYEYSGYGKSAKVAAPGVDILSTMPNNEYTYSSGTSMATAYVTGIAALIKSYKPSLSAKNIADILIKGKMPLNDLKQKTLSEGVINAPFCLEIAKTYS